MYYVYKHCNLTNGRVYIGITRQRPSRRWHSGCGYRGQPLFYNAIRKYGWDGFSHEILESGLSEAEAYEAEKRYIAEYEATNREFGYNIAGGGIDKSRFTSEYRKKLKKAMSNRPPMTMETRLKISLSRKGIKLPPRSAEYRKCISEALTGRVFSEEHCRHISESKTGTQGGANNPRARAVRCVETGEVYACMKDAALATGTNNHNISSVCHGRLQTTGGYHWEYV